MLICDFKMYRCPTIITIHLSRKLAFVGNINISFYIVNFHLRMSLYSDFTLFNVNCAHVTLLTVFASGIALFCVLDTILQNEHILLDFSDLATTSALADVLPSYSDAIKANT